MMIGWLARSLEMIGRQFRHGARFEAAPAAISCMHSHMLPLRFHLLLHLRQVAAATPRCGRAAIARAWVRGLSAKREAATQQGGAAADTAEVSDSEESENSDYVDMINPTTGEWNGPRGLEPTRYGDWERKGRCVDF